MSFMFLLGANLDHLQVPTLNIQTASAIIGTTEKETAKMSWLDTPKRNFFQQKLAQLKSFLKITSNKNIPYRILFLLAAVLLAIAVYHSVFLACSLSCSGDELSAIFVVFTITCGGGAGVLYFLSRLFEKKPVTGFNINKYPIFYNK